MPRCTPAANHIFAPLVARECGIPLCSLRVVKIQRKDAKRPWTRCWPCQGGTLRSKWIGGLLCSLINSLIHDAVESGVSKATVVVLSINDFHCSCSPGL